MNQCDMTGCYDIAEFFADFYQDTETDGGLILEICQSCAEYWRQHKEEKVKIGAFRK